MMTRRFVVLAWLSATVLLGGDLHFSQAQGPAVSAAVDRDQLRIWTNNAGIQVELKFRWARDGFVQFEGRDGKPYSCALAELSKADRDFIDGRVSTVTRSESVGAKIELRTWTDIGGKRAELAFLWHQKGMVGFQDRSGGFFAFPLAELCAADQSLIRQGMQTAKETSTGAGLEAYRSWTDAEGKKAELKLLWQRDGIVGFQDRQGNSHGIPLADLSAKDRLFVQGVTGESFESSAIALPESFRAWSDGDGNRAELALLWHRDGIAGFQDRDGRIHGFPVADLAERDQEILLSMKGIATAAVLLASSSEAVAVRFGAQPTEDTTTKVRFAVAHRVVDVEVPAEPPAVSLTNVRLAVKRVVGLPQVAESLRKLSTLGSQSIEAMQAAISDGVTEEPGQVFVVSLPLLSGQSISEDFQTQFRSLVLGQEGLGLRDEQLQAVKLRLKGVGPIQTPPPPPPVDRKQADAHVAPTPSQCCFRSCVQRFCRIWSLLRCESFSGRPLIARRGFLFFGGLRARRSCFR